MNILGFSFRLLPFARDIVNAMFDLPLAFIKLALASSFKIKQLDKKMNTSCNGIKKHVKKHYNILESRFKLLKPPFSSQV